jgi:hypothetical protein
MDTLFSTAEEQWDMAFLVKKDIYHIQIFHQP